MAKNNKTGSPAARLAALFTGNTRSSGRYDPTRDRSWVEFQGLTTDDWVKHLNGDVGCGVVPIQDDDTCIWGVIDCDNHGSDEDLPIADVDVIVRREKMPLIPCRSKSGGIHAYAFFDKPQPAAKVRALLTAWAGKIGYGGHEVFPKQSKLTVGKDGSKNLGNWVNSPYFDVARTMRYAVVEGKPITLTEFLDLAERSKITDVQLRSLSLADHPDAPPCIQHLYQHGVAQGHRNEGMYNIVIYLKKVDPDTADARAHEVNTTIFQKPLPKAELSRTINSALRDNMQYRCEQEPVRSLCKRDDCLKQKYGITPADADRLDTVESLPEFTNLVKFMSEPVRWELTIDGVRITNIDTEALLDWRAIRILIAERLTRVVPQVKNQEWERVLMPMMKAARVVETPDDASVSGVIRSRLREFSSKCDLLNKGADLEDRRALLRGLPVVQQLTIDGIPGRYVVFRGEDFINFLKRTKSEELKGVNLWFAVKDICQHTKIRAGDSNINVWAVAVSDIMSHLRVPSQAEFRSEL